LACARREGQAMKKQYRPWDRKVRAGAPLLCGYGAGGFSNQGVFYRRDPRRNT